MAAAPDSPAVWLGAPGQSASTPDPCPCVAAGVGSGSWERLENQPTSAEHLTEAQEESDLSRFPQQPKGGALFPQGVGLKSTDSHSWWVVRALNKLLVDSKLKLICHQQVKGTPHGHAWENLRNPLPAYKKGYLD